MEPVKRGARSTLKRTASEFSEDNLTDWAAALTYHGLLALFPALIAFVGIVGLVADPAAARDAVIGVVDQIGSLSVAESLAEPIESVASNSGTAGVMAIAGIVLAAITLLALVTTGPLAEAIGDEIGLSGTAVTIY